MIPAAEDIARDRLARAAGRQAPGRWALWGSVAVLAVLCIGLGLAAAANDVNGVGGWSLFAMAVVPAWASFVVLLSCATTFPAEREAGTLDGLMLTPLSARTIVEALMRPRLRLGLIVLAAGTPFYLMPHRIAGGSDSEVLTHVGVLSTFWRPIIAAVGFSEMSVQQSLSWWPGYSILSGLGAILIDATRLYAFAALGMAASLMARTTARAVTAALGLALAFMFVT